MPKLGEAMTEGLVAQVLVNDGASVAEGCPLYVVQTDKVEMQIDAPASGLVSWKVEANGTYPIGTLLAEIA